MDVTCAILINEHGQVLAAQRSETMKLPLKWEFPGGKVNEGEDFETCITRELREELGIEVQEVKRLKSYPFKSSSFQINLIPFIVNVKECKVCLTEHKQIRWLALEDLPSLDWAEADLPIMRDLVNRIYV